jgi:TonB family protein
VQQPAPAQKDSSSAAQIGSTADTTDTLRTLLQRLMGAIQKNDGSKASALTHDLILPEYQAWFPKVFGAEAGGRMAQRYGESTPAFDANFKQLMSLYVKEKMTDITVTRLDSADQPSTDSYAIRAMRAMQNPVPVYSVAMGKAGESSWNISGIFVFEGGEFRFVDLPTIHELDHNYPKASAGDGVSSSQPPGTPTRIRVGGTIQAGKMIRQVMPSYPSEAKSKHIQGTVVLHAVIAKDGTVSELHVVTGPAELADAAMHAVRQWRYSPTLFNGMPVDIDTTISVVFTLGLK